ELFWVDFPAPSGNSVRVLPGPWTPPTDPVQVTEGKTYVKEAVDENAKFSDEPPADYGDESALRYVDPLVNTTEMDPNSSLSRFELDPKVEGADITFKMEGRGADEPLAPNFDAKGGDIKANQAKNR
ncbi:hypothetical protein, partial [Brevibacterium paucivorans]